MLGVRKGYSGSVIDPAPITTFGSRLGERGMRIQLIKTRTPFQRVKDKYFKILKEKN